MILNPYSFRGVTFVSSGAGYYAEEMDISSGVADLRIRPVAGGRLFDFNYGDRADIIPQPFTIRIFLVGSSSANLQALYETLTHPTTGVIGYVDTFTAKDTQGVSWTCTAGVENIQKILSGDDAIGTSTILEAIIIYFVPVTNWVEVT